MKEEILFEIASLSRASLRVKGFRFGKGGSHPRCVIVGPMSGTAIDQLWIASQLVHFLKTKEEENSSFIQGEMLIIPTLNPYAFNMGQNFWPLDNTDIDVMFPGYEKGETTQRIAARLFEKTNDFDYAIVLEARKDRVECIPYIKLLKTGYENVEDAHLFGLDLIHHRTPTPTDTVSLNYNWQIWNAKSFSIVSGKKGVFCKKEAQKVLDALIRFIAKKEIISFGVEEGSKGKVITREDIEIVKSETAGLLDCLVVAGDSVQKEQPMAYIYDTLNGELLQTIIAPCAGIISCQYDYPLIFQNAIAYRIVKLK